MEIPGWRHRAFQLIQQTFHSRSGVLHPPIPLWFLLRWWAYQDVRCAAVLVVSDAAGWQGRSCLLCGHITLKLMMVNPIRTDKSEAFVSTCSGKWRGALLHSIKFQQKPVKLWQITAQRRSHGCCRGIWCLLFVWETKETEITYRKELKVKENYQMTQSGLYTQHPECVEVTCTRGPLQCEIMENCYCPLTMSSSVLNPVTAENTPTSNCWGFFLINVTFTVSHLKSLIY